MVAGGVEGWGEVHLPLIAHQLLSAQKPLTGGRVEKTTEFLVLEADNALSSRLFSGPAGWRRRPSTKPTRSSCGGWTRSTVSTDVTMNMLLLLLLNSLQVGVFLDGGEVYDSQSLPWREIRLANVSHDIMLCLKSHQGSTIMASSVGRVNT